MNNWLGPFKTADDALDTLRRTVAEIIGTDPHTWPNHKNAPLAIVAAIGLREGEIKQLIKERDALRAKIEAMEQQKPIAEWIESRFACYPQLVWADDYKVVIGTKLYALPGAKGEEK